MNGVNIRTTVIVNNILLDRVHEHVGQRKKEGKKDDFTKFLNRAILNQLEREGDFQTRDLLEEGGE